MRCLFVPFQLSGHIPLVGEKKGYYLVHNEMKIL
jgi:hypothetical protein